MSIAKNTVLAASLLPITGFAADLPSIKGPPPAPVTAPLFVNWTGFYAGGNLGGVWNNSRWSDAGVPPAGFTAFDTDGSGAFGGVQVGYNHQFGNFVLGAEAQANLSGARGSAVSNGAPNGPCGGAAPGNSRCTTSQSWLSTLNGRAGFTFDRFLVYATGGAAFTNYRFTSSSVAPAFTAAWDAGARTGWNIGAGIDYALPNNWVIGFDYKYYDFGGKVGSCTSTPAAVCNAGPPPGVPIRFRETENSASMRVNYRF